MEFVASCPSGFERLLAQELRGLGCLRPRALTGQVTWTGELAEALRVCLWSRLASRVTLVLARIDASSSDALYQSLRDLAWEDHLPAGATFAVDAHGTNAALRSTRFVEQRAKDAISDRLLARRGLRPEVNTRTPDLYPTVRLHGEHATVGINLAGEPLFRRAYEAAPGRTPFTALRSDYAAALLHAGGWPQVCALGTPGLLAMFPGAGTLLVEAAGMARDLAPGLMRTRWGHAGWLGGDSATWEGLVAEAQESARTGSQKDPLLAACDLRSGSDTASRALLRGAGIPTEVAFGTPGELASQASYALAVCDLSWIGGNNAALEAGALSLVCAAGRALEDASAAPLAERPAHQAGTLIAVLERGTLAPLALGAQPTSSLATLVGANAATISTYDGTAVRKAPPVVAGGNTVGVLVSTSGQFAARLAKMAKRRAKWARREDVTCYRVYDADLPDYNLSIDVFEGSLTPGRWLQVSEYAAPGNVDPALARARLLDALVIASHVLEVDLADVHVRTRSRGRGGSQYAKEARTAQGRTRACGGAPLPAGAHLVDEGGLTFEVNFSARHDCGLFLDHRDTRSWLRELAKGRGAHGRFLNLFCYTGTATCYVADGGCRHTTSVDMSRPSLDWTQRNMARNGFGEGDHRLVQADVLRWVHDERHSRNRYDLVFCDVPTFSNSSRMGRRSFDVQRDHAELLIDVSRLLVREQSDRDAGLCVFSCNLHRFRPDTEALARAGVAIEDVTARTIPADFSRTPRVHHCYLVRRAH